MPHAKPQGDIQLGMLAVQQHGLGHRVAHGLEGAFRPYPVLAGNARLALVDTAGLADHRDHLEPVPAKQAVHNFGLFPKAIAEGHPQPGIAQLLGKLDGLPQAGPFPVAFRLHNAALDIKILVGRLAVNRKGLLHLVGLAHRAVGGHFGMILLITGVNGTLGAAVHGEYLLRNMAGGEGDASAPHRCVLVISSIASRGRRGNGCPGLKGKNAKKYRTVNFF